MKILIAEDNKKLAKFLLQAFTEEGYTVDLVGDGATAAQQGRTIPYDMIVLDWMLPELDGLSACRSLREHGVSTPILMLSARADVSERITGLDAGADDYLPKPFDLGELMARCRALTRRVGGDGVQKLGQLTIDRGERKVFVGDKRIDLTPREFSLLAYLARETGRDVPRMEILAKVWETAFDPGSNLIEVHIKNLREKLGDCAKMIETVRGVGYRFVAPR